MLLLDRVRETPDLWVVTAILTVIFLAEAAVLVGRMTGRLHDPRFGEAPGDAAVSIEQKLRGPFHKDLLLSFMISFIYALLALATQVKFIIIGHGPVSGWILGPLTLCPVMALFLPLLWPCRGR